MPIDGSSNITVMTGRPVAVDWAVAKDRFLSSSQQETNEGQFLCLFISLFFLSDSDFLCCHCFCYLL